MNENKTDIVYFKQLAAAIVESAATDLRKKAKLKNSLEERERKRNRRTAIRFFKSQWFRFLFNEISEYDIACVLREVSKDFIEEV